MRRVWGGLKRSFHRERSRWMAFGLDMKGHKHAARMAYAWRPDHDLTREQLSKARTNLLRRYPGK